MKILRKGFVALLGTLFLLAAFARLSAQAPNQLTQKGEPHQIPGCGVSGCYQPYEICVDVPAGAVPLAIVQYYDSFSGWGEFTNPRKTATGFCAKYVQHSNNVTRIVSFDVLYQPQNLPQAIPLSQTEETLLAKVKLGEPIKLSRSEAKLSGDFLQTVISQLKSSETQKMRGLEIDGAEFSDTVTIANATVPFTIRLRNCRFDKPFFVQGARFDGSLVIEDGSFDTTCSSADPSTRCYAFQLQNTIIKEDLIVKTKPSSPEPKRIFCVRDSHVDGRTELTTVTGGEVENLHVTASAPIGLLTFNHLDVNSFRADASVARTTIQELNTLNSRVNTSLEVVKLDIDTFRAVWTNAGELVLSDTAIEQGFDLSFSTLNFLEWEMGREGQFPPQKNNYLTSLVFRSLKITHADGSEGSARNSEPSQGASSAEVATTSLDMLNASEYSASAYDALENLFSGRGDPQAYGVFLAGREARRRSEIKARPILGRFQWCLDLFQEYVFGYGRFAKWLWSAKIRAGQILRGFNIVTSQMRTNF